MDILLRIPKSLANEIRIAVSSRAEMFIDHAAELRLKHPDSQYWLLHADDLEIKAKDMCDFLLDLERRAKL